MVFHLKQARGKRFDGRNLEQMHRAGKSGSSADACAAKTRTIMRTMQKIVLVPRSRSPRWRMGKEAGVGWASRPRKESRAIRDRERRTSTESPCLCFTLWVTHRRPWAAAEHSPPHSINTPAEIPKCAPSARAQIGGNGTLAAQSRQGRKAGGKPPADAKGPSHSSCAPPSNASAFPVV